MKKYIDSEIVELNNEKYLVYLKQVPVRKGKKGEINTLNNCCRARIAIYLEI